MLRKNFDQVLVPGEPGLPGRPPFTVCTPVTPGGGGSGGSSGGGGGGSGGSNCRTTCTPYQSQGLPMGQPVNEIKYICFLICTSP